MNVPIAETSGRRGGIHNSLTRVLVKPTPPDRRVRPALVRLQLPRPDRQPARRGDRGPPPQPGGALLMRVMAQLAMVMNLDKCIGCHTCSVTCKQAWTNRSGVEYVWFNNVETRPGQGYPRRYQDQERWQGGWTLDRRGRLTLQGRRPGAQAAQHLRQPGAAHDRRLLRALDLRLREAHLGAARRRLPGGPAEVADHRRSRRRSSGRANWDDDLGGGPELAARDPIVERIRDAGRGQGDVRVRAGVHVLPAAHLRALPQPVLRRVLPVRRDVQAQPRTASCSSTRTAAAAGGCA